MYILSFDFRSVDKDHLWDSAHILLLISGIADMVYFSLKIVVGRQNHYLSVNGIAFGLRDWRTLFTIKDILNRSIL